MSEPFGLEEEREGGEVSRRNSPLWLRCVFVAGICALGETEQSSDAGSD